jgi:hypothetical protein
MLRLTSQWIKRVLPTTAMLASSALAVFVSPAAQAAISSTERAALVALYNGTQGPTWTNTTNLWTVSAPAGNECTWFGVVCTATNAGHTVTELNLSANNLAGTLPAGLADLTSLQYLRLRGNQLVGSTSVLGSLTQLRYVDLGANQFVGSLPTLSSLPSLQVFAAPGNLLAGRIPSLSGLTNLQVLWLSGNELTGPIPPLTGLTSLQMFYVEGNLLTGELPSLVGLTNLQSFYAGGNRLTGAISSLAGPILLRHYRVESNQLTGGLPSLAALSALEVFAVSGNQISGAVVPVPTSNALVADMSALCPNQLTISTDAAWDAATAGAVWSTGCTAALPSQTLAFGTVPVLTAASMNGQVNVSSSPLPGSSAPIVYSSLSPSICTVNASSGIVTLLPSVPMGSICTIAANKAGDGSYNSAVQVAQAIKISGVCRLDVNGDAQRNAIDAVLIARYLSGVRGSALIAGLIPFPIGSARTTATDIENFLAAQDYDVRGISPSNPSSTRDLLVANRYINGVVASPQLVRGTDIATDLPTTTEIFNRLTSWCNF